MFGAAIVLVVQLVEPPGDNERHASRGPVGPGVLETTKRATRFADRYPGGGFLRRKGRVPSLSELLNAGPAGCATRLTRSPFVVPMGRHGTSVP